MIATQCASAYTAAADLKAAGLEVAVVDLRPESDCAPEAAALRAAGCEVLTGHTVVGSHGAKARHRPDRRSRGRIRGGRRPRTLTCDCVGLVRRLDARGASVLAVARQGSPSMRRSTPSYPATSVQAERSAGACQGHLSALGNASTRAGRPARPRRARERRVHSRRARRRTGFRPVRIMPGCDGPTARPRPSSTCRTTSPPRTSRSPCARASSRSSTSSATPPPAWRPTRARPRT